jgi:transposase
VHNKDIEQIVSRYLEGATTRQIGAEIGVPHRTISRWINKAGISLRNPGAPIIPQLQDRGWLECEYVGKGKSSTEIASEVNCSAGIVSAWLRRHGIETRDTGSTKGHRRNSSPECRAKMSESKRGVFIGESNPNWKGGVAFKDPDRNRYPYKRWAKAVKDRDEWACRECGSKDRLHAHHVKRWRDYPDLRYDVGNGLTLCHTCHEAAHGRGFKFRWPKHAEKPTSASVPSGI